MAPARTPPRAMSFPRTRTSIRKAQKPTPDPIDSRRCRRSPKLSAVSMEALREAAGYLARPSPAATTDSVPGVGDIHNRMKRAPGQDIRYEERHAEPASRVPATYPVTATTSTTITGTGPLILRLTGSGAVDETADSNTLLHIPRRSPRTTREPSGLKRGLDEMTEPPVKRRRASKGSATLAGKLSTKPQNSRTELLHDLQNYPDCISLAEISALFDLIKDNTSDLVRRYFKHELSDAEQANWPLHLLTTKHTQLFLTTQYLADGNQYTWRRFFTEPQPRMSLVYGILGEWLTQRVLGHTAFGLPPAQIEQLENIDREYLHHEAFVRSKRRANQLQELLYGKSLETRKNELDEAAAGLAAELMVVLEPLMRPTAGGASNDEDQQENDYSRLLLRADLISLIKQTAALQHAIRLTGANGTIVRICPHVPKSTELVDDAPFRIVNLDMIARDQDSHLADGDVLRIKMTCWGRVEAVVPFGPDVTELESLEHGHRIRLCDGEAFTWDKHEQTTWPILPPELQVDNYAPPDRKKTTNRSSKSDTPKRGAYVKHYPNVHPADVYCEWTPTATTTTVPQPAARSPLHPCSSSSSLIHAVQEARAARSDCRLQDRRRAVAQTLWSCEPLMEWGLVVAAVVALRRGLPSSPENWDLVNLLPTKEALARLQRLLTDVSVRDLVQSPGECPDLVVGVLRRAIADPVLQLWSDVARSDCLRYLRVAVLQVLHSDVLRLGRR